MIDELLQLVRLDRNWVKFQRLEGNRYAAHCTQATWLKRMIKTGSDYFGMYSNSIWLADGPKVFKPTPEQIEALSNVKVNLPLSDYTQPFPAMAVSVNLPPFQSCICYHDSSFPLLICNLGTKGGVCDIVTTVGTLDGDIEQSLQRFDDDCASDAVTASKVLRVAVNSCLALSHFGCHYNYLFPKEVESDTRLAEEDTPRGQRARFRLPLAMLQVKFDREVVLHRTAARKQEPGEPTGRHVGPHWRSGHWAMQACGPRHSERKRIFRPGVFVRQDLFIGDKDGTSTTFRTT